MSETTNQPIVVGIDGSMQSLAALRWALHQGVQCDRPVHIVHCWQPETLTDLALVAPHTFARASVCMLDNEIGAALTEMDVKPEVQSLSLHGRPATALVSVAEGAAMLVLGSHGHTGLKDVVFGQIIRSCDKHAPCPVVIVDAHGFTVRRHTRRPVGAGR